MGKVNPGTLIGGAGKTSRKAADFYPTPANCTEALVQAFPHFGFSHVWEPACGDGAICKVLESHGARIVASDLFDRGYGDAGVDFLSASLPSQVSAIVTNPPYTLAAPFIERATSYGVWVAMLLRGSYWHAKTRHHLFRHTGPVAVCPLLWRPRFAPERGKSPTMEYQWTVWKPKPAEACRYFPLPKPKPRECV
jgi:hypothetical protein